MQCCSKKVYLRNDFNIAFHLGISFEKMESVSSSQHLKGRMHCFSMQVIMNKCFLLNPEKNAHIRLVTFKKNAKNAPLISKNVVTEPKARQL